MTRDELEDLARLVAPLVARDLARLLSAAGGTEYSTRKGREPEGYSRDAWRAIAHRIGTKRGRWWVVTREQLAEYEGRGKAPVVHPTPRPGRPWHPSDSAAALGLRPVRKEGR